MVAPAGVETIAKWSFLPLSVGYNAQGYYQSWCDGGKNDLVLTLGDSYDMRVAHATIDKLLADAVAAGDSPFVLDFTKSNDPDEKTAFELFTKPSLIQASLKTRSSVVLQDPPRISRSTFNPLAYARWWILPTLFAALMWMLFFSPALVLETVPPVWNNGTKIMTVSCKPL